MRRKTSAKKPISTRERERKSQKVKFTQTGRSKILSAGRFDRTPQKQLPCELKRFSGQVDPDDYFSSEMKGFSLPSPSVLTLGAACRDFLVSSTCAKFRELQ